MYTHTHQSQIDLEILGWQAECWISREALLFQQRDAPVWVCCWYSPKLYNELSPETQLETLTTVHQILKSMDVLTCMKGRQGQHKVLHSNIWLWEQKDLWEMFLFFKAAASHGLNHCRAELILHRICINGGNAACHSEMSGPLSHTAPDSMVYCLCPGVEPQTYKSKVWAQSWGHLGRRAVQALHCHDQGTVPDSRSLTVNPPRQVGLLHRW